MKALENYLRMYRKRSGLTQGELAYLLGVQSSGKISRYERFTRRPTLETALALEVILGVAVNKLFEGLSEQVAYDVKKRARRLCRRLAERHAHQRKLATVTAIQTRSNEEVAYEAIR